MIYIFIFRCVSTLKVKIIIILLTDQPKIILPTAIQQKIKLPSPNTKFTNQAQNKKQDTQSNLEQHCGCTEHSGKCQIKSC